jgi:hypothetical protein
MHFSAGWQDGEVDGEEQTRNSHKNNISAGPKPRKFSGEQESMATAPLEVFRSLFRPSRLYQTSRLSPIEIFSQISMSLLSDII